MYFDLTKDEDEPELINSSFEEISLLSNDDSLNNTKKRKHKVTPPSQSKKHLRPDSPLQKKEEEEDMIFLELDDEDEVDEEEEEEEEEEDVVILSPIPIPIQKQSIQRKVSSSAVIGSSSMEKKRANISSSNIGLQSKGGKEKTSKEKTSSSALNLEGSSSALTGSSAIIPVHTRASTSAAPTSWKWTCPDCLKEYAGATNDKRIEIRRAGVLGDCGAKKTFSSLHSSSSSSSSSPASPPMFTTFSTVSTGIEDSHCCSADASNWEVILLLDSREVRTQKDRDYIPNGLMSKEGVICEKRSLPLGDITWIARRKADAPKPAKVPLHLIRASGRGRGGGGDGISRSQSGHQSTLDSDFGYGMQSSSSSSTFLKSTSSSSLLPAKKASTKEKDDAKKAQKESDKALKEIEKKAKILAASSAPRAEEEYMLDYIIERKSCNDLAASIIDGRYNEQKLRLANSGMRVTYLIEGDPHQTSLGGTGGPRAAFGGGPLKIGAKHILTAMANTQVLAGFHVVQTTTIDATIAHLGAMHRIVEANFLSSLACQRESSIEEEGREVYTRTNYSSSSSSSSTPIGIKRKPFNSGTSGMSSSKGDSQSSSSSSSSSHKICPNDCCTLMGRPTVLQRVMTYASWSQLMKRPRHFTAMNLFGQALRQVNGCSAERAQAILERYPTPASLLLGYKNLKYPLRDGPTMLQGLPVRGQKACIGPALSRNVYDAFQGESQSGKKKIQVDTSGKKKIQVQVDGEDEEEEDEGKIVGEDETFG
jgi:ERCC4-type nuclease